MPQYAAALMCDSTARGIDRHSASSRCGTSYGPLAVDSTPGSDPVQAADFEAAADRPRCEAEPLDLVIGDEV